MSSWRDFALNKVAQPGDISHKPTMACRSSLPGNSLRGARQSRHGQRPAGSDCGKGDIAHEPTYTGCRPLQRPRLATRELHRAALPRVLDWKRKPAAREGKEKTLTVPVSGAVATFSRSSAIHFQGRSIRQVSCYTLLGGFRLPWPPPSPCCLYRPTPFVGSDERQRWAPRPGVWFILQRQFCLPKVAHSIP